MKFVHTADWQIGMRAAHVGANGFEVRNARFTAAQRVIEIARDRGADAILVTGDTFEDNAVQTTDIQRVSDILASFGGPVYIIPGNHDPAVASSLWQHAGWNRANLHVLLKPEPIEAATGITLFPCPLDSKTSRLDPTAWIASAGENGVRIGLAHGTVQGATVVEDVFPIPRDAATRCGLDFLALGHWHSTAAFDEDLSSARMAYAGTHETTKFGERDSGNVLLVEVAARGELPRVEQIRTGGLTWLNLVKTINSEVDLEALVNELDGVSNPAATLLDLRLEGILAPGAISKLQHVRDILNARFTLYSAMDDTALLPEPTDGAWIDSLPIGMMRTVAQRLLNSAPTSSEEARMALMHLYRCAQGEAA
ncbi:MAG: DNA repair exonuclease [Candidatus Eremiobacteraeota bacterium]|nr:DNA repair exonuclease [Candidatus Eremiobacteraeota bacterium]